MGDLKKTDALSPWSSLEKGDDGSHQPNRQAVVGVCQTKKYYEAQSK